MNSSDQSFDQASWAQELERGREATRRAFRDGHQSPYAAVARHDLQGDRPLLLGSDPACDAQLEGLLPRHATVRLEGDRFSLEAQDEGARLRILSAGHTPAEVRSALVGPGAKVEVGRYVLRLSHQNFPAVLVLDPSSPRLREGSDPVWFPPDAALRVVAELEPDQPQREEVVLSTRGNKRRALRLGRLRFSLGGQELRLTALRLLEPGVGESAVSVYFRDQTSGHESYPVGRYVDAEPVAGRPGHYLLDFNRAYNPSCAFSPLYNCPIPVRENLLPVAVRAGERDPGAH